MGQPGLRLRRIGLGSILSVPIELDWESCLDGPGQEFI